MTDETTIEPWRGVGPEAEAWCGGDDDPDVSLPVLLYRAVAHGVRMSQERHDMDPPLDADAIERGEVTRVDIAAGPPAPKAAEG